MKTCKTRTKVYPRALVEHPNMLCSDTILGWLYRRDVDAASSTMGAYEVPDEMARLADAMKGPTPPWYMSL